MSTEVLQRTESTRPRFSNISGYFRLGEGVGTLIGRLKARPRPDKFQRYVGTRFGQNDIGKLTSNLLK